MSKRVVACLVAVSAGATIVLVTSGSLVGSGSAATDMAAASQAPAAEAAAQTAPRTSSGQPDM